LAQAGELVQAPGTIFTALNDVELSFGTSRDAEGSEIELSHGRVWSLLEQPDRLARWAAFGQYQAAYAAHRRSRTCVHRPRVAIPPRWRTRSTLWPSRIFTITSTSINTLGDLGRAGGCPLDPRRRPACSRALPELSAQRWVAIVDGAAQIGGRRSDHATAGQAGYAQLRASWSISSRG
jgi:hypothetical protein